MHVGFNYVVKAGQKVRKDTKTHQERWITLDPISCAFIRESIEVIDAKLASVGLHLVPDAYLFSSEPMHTAPWNPNWVSHEVANLAEDASVDLNIRTLRHYAASQLLAA
jgi:integrase